MNNASRLSKSSFANVWKSPVFLDEKQQKQREYICNYKKQQEVVCEKAGKSLWNDLDVKLPIVSNERRQNYSYILYYQFL